MDVSLERTKLGRVYRMLHGRIASGAIAPGERLPTEAALAKQLGYSRATVATAVRMLVDDGLVERRKRAGSFVRQRVVVRGKGGAERATHAALFGAIIRQGLPNGKTDNVFAPTAQEIGHRIERAGHALVVHDPSRHAADREELVRRIGAVAQQLIDRRVAGVFVLPHEIEPGRDESVVSAAVAQLSAAGIPVVLLDRDLYHYPRRSTFDVVHMDNERAGYVMTQHLLSLGCRHIDFLALPSYATASDDRIAGYRRAMSHAGLDPDSGQIHRSWNDREPLLAILNKSKAEAIVAVNDDVATFTMQLALSMGRRVPQDLRIVGCDDVPQSKYLASPLTTILQSGEAIGAAAVATMFDRIADPRRGPVDVLVGFELVVRESCGARLTGRRET